MLAVLIDYPGFNMRIAEFAKKEGIKNKIKKKWRKKMNRYEINNGLMSIDKVKNKVYTNPLVHGYINY